MNAEPSGAQRFTRRPPFGGYFSRRLVRKLALAIVGVTLLVAVGQGTVAYLTARNALDAEIYARLEDVRRNKARQVLDYVAGAFTRTGVLAKEPETTVALEKLFAYHRTRPGIDDGPFDTKGDAYKKLRLELDPAYRNRMATKGFDDILLVCAAHGHVMFNMDLGRELGTNLRTGPYKTSSLARVWRRVVETGKPAVEDYALLDEADGTPDLFIGAPVYDGEQRLVAVVVEEFSTTELNDILLAETALGKTGEILLVGEDRLLRNNPRFTPGNSILRVRSDTESVRDALAGRVGTAVYADYRGVNVLGSYAPLGLKQAIGTAFDWAIVVKQDWPEAFAPLANIARRSLGLTAGALLIALFVGVGLARSMAKNVTSMAAAADAIAGGDFASPIAVSGRDEIAQLGASLRQMQTSLRDTLEKNRRAEAGQRQAAEYTRSLIEANLDALVTIGPDGKVTDVNRATVEATGLPREQLIGTDFADYFTDPAKARAGYQQVFRDGVVRNYPLDLRHRNGTVRPVHYNASVYKDETGQVIGVFAAARDVSDVRAADWLKTGIARLNDCMRGEEDGTRLANKIITELCTFLDAKVGVLYVAQDEGPDAGVLTLLASYAHIQRKTLSNRFRPGEGLVGQAALERHQVVIRNAPDDYIRVISGLGETAPRQICVTPFLFEDRVRGVIEIGTLGELDALQLNYLAQAAQSVGIAFETALGRVRLAQELARSQQLTEELQTQQEELRTVNEELEQQAVSLKQSEERLKQQQEELQVTNEELEEKNLLLERQKREVERARKDIEDKAAEVALGSKYKSEFLANMSHELRTPLNSLLLLAQGLAENRDGNLTGDQVESAKVIHGSGNDLLKLINEILDLAKIEAGRTDLQLRTIKVGDLADGVRASFAHMAQDKGLRLDVTVREDGPAEIVSDQKRVEQVVRNLLSNAIKFTEAGTVSVTLGRPAPGTDLSRSGLSAGNCLAVAVADTGIGIAPEHQKVVFEAFQQVDGGTARKYPGTGLGLSISRELARLLGGEIQLVSEPNTGSTFTLFIPVVLTAERPGPARVSAPLAAQASGATVAHRSQKGTAPVAAIDDDRASVGPDDRVMLVIEDDPAFAQILRQTCHEKGFKCIAAASGESGLELARTYLPSGVLLDIRLPGIDGWEVLRVLKDETRTRHIPVHIVSVEEASAEALRQGAIGFATKPLTLDDLEETFRKLDSVSTGRSRRVLVVEDTAAIRRDTVALLSGADVTVDSAESGAQALEAIRAHPYDCVVLDLGLPDMDGLDLLDALKRDGVAPPPVIIHTARDLTRAEEMSVREHADSIVVKDVRSQERLLDEVSLFLHRVVSRMPDRSRQIITNLHDTDALLAGKRVLIVDDDMRTMFALTRLLSDRGMTVLKAENGERALRLLDQSPGADLVLMDIMMPVMDGYEAIRRIRAQERFRQLPVIALTAKAMRDDRDKCLTAGANDYLPKPVDPDRLISMMRVWLYR